MSFVMGRPVLMREPALWISARIGGSVMTAVTVELLSSPSNIHIYAYIYIYIYTKIEALLVQFTAQIPR